MKDELGGKIITEFVVLRPKTYSYLKKMMKILKKLKEEKKCVIKRIFKFNDYKNCLFKNEIILKYNKDLKLKDIVYIIKNNPEWPYIPNHPYRILIAGGSGSGKTNALLN